MTLLLEDLDLEALLAPIPGDAPAGTDLRLDYTPTSIYFRLRDARAEARDAERQSESGGEEGLPTHWRTVASLAMKALQENTKDLEVATWLTEALLRTAGLRGMSTGAAIIKGLIERYWDDLFPMPDEDGMETRVGPLAGLSGQGYDGTLIQPLRKLPLFNRPNGTPFGLWQYEATRELSGITDSERRGQRIEAGVIPYDEVEKEARIAGVAHWTNRRREVSGTMESWLAMGEAVDAKAGNDSPSVTRVRDILQLIMDTCNQFAPPDTESEAAAPGEAVVEHSGVAVAGGAPGVALAPGAIGGREQALRQLGEIASWFKRNEPHSPLAYTLDEAVRRGRMSWPDLVEELIPDETARHALLSSLGIKPPAPVE